MALKNIVLVGASTRTGMTGNLGTYVLSALASNPAFKLTVISRASSNSVFDPSFSVVRVSDAYTEEEMVSAFKGQDAVILTTGHGLTNPNGIVDAAIKAGVKRFIPSEFGSNSQNKGAVGVFPMMAGKAALVDYLRSKESTGLSWTALATGIFFDLGLASGFLGYDLKAQKATIWDEGTARFSTSTRSTVAKAVEAVLERPEETKNQYLYISSFETSMKDILSSLQRNTGADWEVTKVETEEQIKDAMAGLKTGNFAKAGQLVLAASFKGGLGADFATEEKLANGLLGLPKEDLDEEVKKIVEEAK